MMNINELIDSDLLLINHDQKNLFIELVFLLSNKVRVKLFAFNKDTSTILVNYFGLSIRAGFSTLDDVPSLGEVESVNVFESGLNIEGDFGFIGITADKWTIGKAI